MIPSPIIIGIVGFALGAIAAVRNYEALTMIDKVGAVILWGIIGAVVLITMVTLVIP